jgi:N-acetylglutamate synthase-like GNAT family acetyltransferase
MIKQNQIEVRIANPEDIPAIAKLTEPWWNGVEIVWMPEAADNWLVAEAEGKVYGCVQLCIGNPVGRCEMLCIDPGLSPRSQHEICLAICRAGAFALAQTGAQVITVFVSFGDKGFKRMLKRKFGCFVATSGNLLTTTVGAVQ